MVSFSGKGPNHKIDGTFDGVHWKFSSGYKIQKFYWKAGDPAGTLNNCLVLSAPNKNSWGNVSCNKDRGYICEKLI